MTMNHNVGLRLSLQANIAPNKIAIASPVGSHRQGTARRYDSITMRDLDVRSSSIAAGLQSLGIGQGKRIGLLVRFGQDFITLVFAVLKSGATLVLIDPGMGRKNLIDCLSHTKPDGFIAIPVAHAVLRMFAGKFPNAKLNVTVGRRWWGMPSPTLSQLEKYSAADYRLPFTSLDDPAAVIFTTGSTGPPKGVLYTHRTFNAQIDQVAGHYGILPGGKDLACFPLFGLFNAVMGTTTVLPDMNPIRPADVVPTKLLDAIDQWQINQSFGSPALWTKVGSFCQSSGRKAPSLKLVLSAGAPVPSRVLGQMRSAIHPYGQMHTPYGATEALPLASIESRVVLEQTSQETDRGAGTCVGNRFSGIEWRVIAIEDGPIASIDEVQEVPNGSVGELMVTGDVVTHQYVTRADQNAIHKVMDGDRVWHRMGDVGYLDEQDRFWFCGRKAHRVITNDGPLFTENIEPIANTHPSVYRSALVGVGSKPNQEPLLILEPWQNARPKSSRDCSILTDEVLKSLQATSAGEKVRHAVIYPKKLPTDIRHNSKIFREKLTVWANSK
jgi:olefin beta-lactone synthetase